MEKMNALGFWYVFLSFIFEYLALQLLQSRCHSNHWHDALLWGFAYT